MPRRRRRAIALVVAFLGLAACSGARPTPVARPAPAASASAGTPRIEASKDGDFAPRIDYPEVWQAVAAKPGSEHLANTEVVKVIIDSVDGQTYFLQSERWPIHYFFANKFLSTRAHPVGDEGAFNKREYHQPDRRFVLGTVAHYVDADAWTFELYAGDTLDVAATVRAFETVRKLVYFGDRLRYRPVPPAHERAIDEIRRAIPVVTTDEIFGKTSYQALELGDAWGYLRILPAGKAIDWASIRPYDIVVLGDLPEDVPVVSGIVSAQLQAPLGHINVLCHNRHTPNMALRGAATDPRFASLDGKLAHLVVEGQSFRLEPASQADAERAWASRRPKEAVKAPRDPGDPGLPTLAAPEARDVGVVGAKTAQLARVASLLPQSAVPKAFGLPFHAYDRFLAINGFDRRIDGMLADPTFQNDPEKRRRELDALRDAMMHGVVPKDVLEPLLDRMKAELSTPKVRLRSSTNAEDLPGFNGAGLYRSTRVDPTNPDDVARGLREVWSSVWLWGAFEERQFYRIDQKSVAMGILVQESIDDDVANGVAITANPFNQGQPGFFINAQVSGASVTGARGDEVPEQVLYYTYEDGRGFERLSKSSRANGGVVLRDEEVEKLHEYLATIHHAFTGDDFGMTGRAVDVEFLVAGSPRRVVVVQARPYTVSWAGDRRWLDDDGEPIVR